ncbi:hypothetical protein COV06_02185 [Candidatus Uhrbacteria bacterium CG10_big_fil_rev_8_21_14_0_10_50_16]|uniref:Glycosyltransferase RgtA/B/C/D-like domain-containing protein n=1 Tax=Candidatus Uhrbacteria bacterium CG10_big_fil_rev_8_21_14_0_10_50_16 TaxID=1975039 RepID=A0A2H0RMH4_9BACT|nr:MAG: hypothetical protein COV06_02185 [Candidatus Uhrbacteria bacterium CG10_big_fil_rev_8_21_14_0_10_50_16]
MKQLFPLKYSIGTVLGLAGLSLGAFLTHLPLVTTLSVLFLLTLASLRLGRLFDHTQASVRALLGLLVALSFLMITGAGVYYVGFVTIASYFWVLAALPFFAWLVTRNTEEPETESTETIHGSSGLYASFIVIALIAYFVTLTGHTTLLATRSPWLIITPQILGWIGLAGFGLLQLAKRGSIRLSLIGTMFVLFSIVSVAAFVFPLGYGFDPFLHQATIDYITLHGTITPKPLYYVGQYALELIGVLFTGVSTQSFDTFLLPVLAALLLPSVAAASTWQITKRHLPTALAAIGTLLLPLSSFINTTPQGLANLWTLCVFFLGLPELITGHRWVSRWVLVIVALAAVLVHPLAGLPAVLFVTLMIITTQSNWSSSLRRILTVLVSIGGAVMLPIAFSLSGSGYGHLQLHLSNLSHLLPATFFSTRFNVIGDLATFLGTNQWLWLIALALVACVLLWNLSHRTWLLVPLTAGLLLINAILLSAAGDFSFLIDYEQTNYVDRVIHLVIFAIAPLALLGFALGVERLLQMKKHVVTIGITLLFLTAITSVAYASYPRHDTYSVSRGFTVSKSDHTTVTSIQSHAKNIPYVVLANQAVSAAAIQDFGFAHYYGPNTDVFYYPVPTGGPLYQLYLDMIEETPTRAIALQAMDIAGVDRLYFVINDYWWSSERAFERAKLSTDTWFQIDNGATTVFIYSR